MFEKIEKPYCQCLFEIENKLPRTQHCFMPCFAQGEVLRARASNKKTSVEWLKEIPAEFKFKLLDPDGWDRGEGWQYGLYEELITKEEFKKRLMVSTVQCSVGFFSNW